VLEEAYIPAGEGVEGKTTQNVTVGGVGLDGEDATNELTTSAGRLRRRADGSANFGVRLGPMARECS